jgi:fructose-1-phosphate kinase PfkB-like protein
MDKRYYVERLRPNDNDTERALGDSLCAAGKGNNAARALTRLGFAVNSTGFQGGWSGHYCTSTLRAEGVCNAFVSCATDTRGTMTIQESDTGINYNFLYLNSRV